MITRLRLAAMSLSLWGVGLTGCATSQPYDYSNLLAKKPQSILVLPPINQSTDVRGTYGYYSTVTQPLAEMGYYVFPIAIVDDMLKENGLPNPEEMHQAPLKKLAEIFGTDSVLYMTLLGYGSQFHVLTTAAAVRVSAKLVDAKSGLLLWEGQVSAQQQSSSAGGGLFGALVGAVVTQISNSATDAAHRISQDANALLFRGERLPAGSSHADATGGPPLLYGPFSKENEK